MSEVQPLLIQEDGEEYIIYVETKDDPEMPNPVRHGDGREGKGGLDITKLQDVRQMIRGYTVYAISAFKNFKEAEIEEVTVSFGLKLGGKVGIPYITEGSTESNLQIQVKCKFPTKPDPDSTT